jgi:hypothetical protein
LQERLEYKDGGKGNQERFDGGRNESAPLETMAVAARKGAHGFKV